MARKKISEFRAKTILFNSLGKKYGGISIDATKDLDSQISESAQDKRYVLKVDQGIKQRNKKGLIDLDVNSENIKVKIEELKTKGYSHFLIEEFFSHDVSSEKYLAIERVREGKRISYSNHGGVGIEENSNSVKNLIIKNYEQTEEIARVLGIDNESFNVVLNIFDESYFSFLEINPLVVDGGNYNFLDAAVEVDGAAEFFVTSLWNSNDFRESRTREKTFEEVEIEKLKEKSPASFSYEILNPDGSLFLLLSGGGASLVTADEIYQQGKGNELSNYGEYSGNPNTEETYIYTKNLLTTLLHSNAPRKAIIISGGVANFTDVRKTFRGIILAMKEVSDKMREQNVKVFVRRGGPFQKEGLTMMKEFLEKEDLLGIVSGPDMVLTDIVKPALEHIA